MNSIDRIDEYDALKKNLFYHSMNAAPVSKLKAHLGSALEAIESLQVHIAETEKLIRVLRYDIDSRVRINEVLNAEIHELREIKFRRFHDDECWIFSDDGEDYPESLACPVVMSAEKLRELLSYRVRIAELESEQSEAIDSGGEHHD